MAQLSFHGGAREVTGACYLFETDGTKILIDCGLFQGDQECSELNFEPFRFRPNTIDAVLVTHAHLDHIGRIPRLVREGFSGTIYSTAATRDLARFILEDALFLAERRGEALYTDGDLERTFSLWRAVPYGDAFEVKNIGITLHDAGHILGSSFVQITAEGKKWLFTGDLGNTPSILLPPPEVVRGVTNLVIESTYGNRNHESAEERVLKFERAVEDAVARRGTLLIPAFATERTQDILFLLNEMLLDRRIPEVPIFVDAPLAIKITEVFERYPSAYNADVQKLLREHQHLFKFRKLQFTGSVEESKKINEVPPPKVVIAGSGMMQGGRILHHARRYLPDSKSILLVIGYQAAGSLGRRLIDGEKSVKVFKEEVVVEAEIRKINGFSAHADNPQLFSLVDANRDTLERVFVVQGEETAALHFMQEILDRLGLQVDAPVLYEKFEV